MDVARTMPDAGRRPVVRSESRIRCIPAPPPCTLRLLKKLAIALHTTTDSLVFDENERRLTDDLQFMFEAIGQFTPEDKAVVKKMLQGLVIQHRTQQVAEAS